MKTLIRFPLFGLVILLSSCAVISRESRFLSTGSPEWADWLDEVVDVRLENLPLHLLPTTAEFESGSFLITEEQAANVRISFRADRISRRVALQRIAKKYKLMVRFWPSVEAPRAIVVATSVQDG